MEMIHSGLAPAAVGPYSQAVKAGNWLFLSGQGGLLPEGGLVAGGVAAEAEQAMRNIGAVLQAAGAGFENVVSVTCYLTDMQDFGLFNEIYARYFAHKPARTCIAAKELPKGMQCEIQVTAYCGD